MLTMTTITISIQQLHIEIDYAIEKGFDRITVEPHPDGWELFACKEAE